MSDDDDMDLDDMLSGIADDGPDDFWGTEQEDTDPLSDDLPEEFTLPDPPAEEIPDEELMIGSVPDTPTVDDPDSERETLSDEDFGALAEMVAMNSTEDDYPSTDLRQVPPPEPSDDPDPDAMSALLENDILGIRLASERQERVDDSERVLAKQISTNARGFSIHRTPVGISMISRSDEKPDPEIVRTGDEKRLKWLAVASLCVIASVVASVVVAMTFRPEIPSPQIAYGQSQNIGGGTVIDRNAAPAGDPGGDATGGGQSSGENAVVPDGGSRVKYSVRAEGEISSASATYIDASGLPVQETGISLPWEITIGARASVTPNFAVAARGFGTLTCEVTSDGETVATKTATGESPTVNCTA